MHEAGCHAAYIDGSFVTAKEEPGDFDGCWEADGIDVGRLDPVLCDFSEARRAQKERYGGEFFPADAPADPTGVRFLAYFQLERDTGEAKGIIKIDLGGFSVIANERQYRIAKAELRRFEEAVGKYIPGPGVDPRMKGVMDDALRSEVEVLSAQIKRYEDLRDGRVSRREIDGLRDLPTALIEARIAAGLTQRALADRLRVPEQQVQRWEANLYSGVGVERLQEVTDALGMGIKETVSYAVSALPA